MFLLIVNIAFFNWLNAFMCFSDQFQLFCSFKSFILISVLADKFLKYTLRDIE